MRPCCSNIQIIKPFPSTKSLLRNGNSHLKITPFTSIAASTNKSKSNSTHHPLYHHLISLLRNSITHQSLRTQKTAHCIILRSGLLLDLFLSNNLLHSYCSCGSIPHAARLFDNMSIRDAISYNTMISGFITLGLNHDGFRFFIEMMRAGTHPTQSSFASILVASAKMAGGVLPLRQVHGICLKSGFSADCRVGNALSKGYVDLGGVDELRKVSDDMCEHDKISFEILVRGYAKHGVLDYAFDLLKYSRRVGVNFSPYAVSSLISICVNVQQVECGTQVHGYVIKVGLGMNVSVVNSLITLYSRSQRLEDAETLFGRCRSRDIVTWNSLISGFAYNSEGDAGTGLVWELLASGIGISGSTFLSFLSCCASITVLDNAKRAHALIFKLREEIHQGIDNIILTMYCKCGSLENAETVFEEMDVRDIVSFNLIAVLYRNCSSYEKSIMLLFQAQSEGLQIDEVMLSGVVCSCSKLGLLDVGLQIHGWVMKTGFDKETHLLNSLLEMYSRCGKLDEMNRVFQHIKSPDLFSWNTMLIGYAHYGLLNKSIVVWQEMESSGLKLNEFSYSALLDTCGGVSTLLMGDQIHCRIQKMGLVFDTVLMNSLLTMYSNCQKMEKALAVFKETCSLDSASWNAMVSGYAQNYFAEESVKFYIAMKKNGIETNYMTFASISMSSALLADFKLGSQVHAQVIKGAFEQDSSVCNSLITMYAKCGDMHESSKIFERTIHRDVITWNSMICACADHGQGRDAIDVLMQMILSGMKPNNVSFVGVLAACSRAGLLLEACYLFNSMHSEHGIDLGVEHYTCMVDILCRVGKVEEAKDLIESTRFARCLLVWKTLLSACKVNENVELGEVAAERISRLEPQDSSSYVLLSDLYASVGKRTNKAELRRLMKDRGVKKEVGSSWIL